MTGISFGVVTVVVDLALADNLLGDRPSELGEESSDRMTVEWSRRLSYRCGCWMALHAGVGSS